MRVGSNPGDQILHATDPITVLVKDRAANDRREVKNERHRKTRKSPSGYPLTLPDDQVIRDDVRPLHQLIDERTTISTT